jgi:hypothetical protein
MSDPTAISRRLVAVFAADVEGYSRLMGADEVGTLKGLTERRVILDRIIGEHGGRIANTAGDSVLAKKHRRAQRRLHNTGLSVGSPPASDAAKPNRGYWPTRLCGRLGTEAEWCFRAMMNQLSFRMD